MNARQKGADMTVEMIDRVVDQLAINGVETVNLGGNEPLFTNGVDPRKTLLPYIIERLTDAGIVVGLTTSGITVLKLYKDHRDAFDRLNDMSGSLSKVMNGLQQGDGTAGMVLKDKQLYENMNAAVVELRSTLQETRNLLTAIQKDPKRYLNIKVSLW